jgi:hypothetical protein
MKHKPELDDLLERADASLLDLVDHVVNQGVVLTGEVFLGLAGIDLIYLRIQALLSGTDRLLPRRKRR